MNLIDDLEAHLVRYEPGAYPNASTLADADGVMFQCPKCHPGHMVLCWFRGRRAPPDVGPGPGRWEVSGTSLADLTLSPSVHLNKSCGWHGWVRNGCAT